MAYRHQNSIRSAEFLLNLSSIVRSLLIAQLGVPHKEPNERHFLGADDFDWAPAIIGKECKTNYNYFGISDQLKMVFATKQSM